MNPNITLGEVKAHCIEMFERYKDKCCENCEFSDLGCCDAPESWKLDEDTPVDSEKVCESRPDWEEMYQLAYAEHEECRNRANLLEAENARYRTIINTIEFILGRKFDL